MTAALDDAFARLRDEAGVDRLSYFHCDHFEPWRWGDGRDGVDQQNADDVIHFAHAMRDIPYARRLTLFMKSPIGASLPGRWRGESVPGDEIEFSQLRPQRRAILAPAMRAIVECGHELQIHIHHERFTRNDWYSTSPDRPENKLFREFLTERSTPAMDAARLDLYIKMTLALFRLTSGQPLRQWMFVHGMWSLNGSDRHFCCIDDEIAILQKHGCVGDFTFPAPREHCNPGEATPYLCRPVDAPKGYDHPDAAAVAAQGQQADGRFFLWSTDVSTNVCSLDTVSSSYAELSADPAAWALGLIRGAVVRDGAVHVKTHAHSMMPVYFDGLPAPAYPHADPAIRRMFDHLIDATERAGLTFELSTADEVYRRFVTPDPLPAPLKPRPRGRGRKPAPAAA
jgi:hypothetical protein